MAKRLRINKNPKSLYWFSENTLYKMCLRGHGWDVNWCTFSRFGQTKRKKKDLRNKKKSTAISKVLKIRTWKILRYWPGSDDCGDILSYVTWCVILLGTLWSWSDAHGPQQYSECYLSLKQCSGVTKCVKKIFPTPLHHQQLELLIKCSMDPFFHVYGFC